jgi:hypothetical protein
MLFDNPKNVFTRGRDQRELYAGGKKPRKEVKKKKIVETQEDLEQSLIMGKSFMSYTPNIDTDGIKYVPTTKAFVEMEDDDDDDFGLAGVVDVDFGEMGIGIAKDVSLCESAFGGSGFTTNDTTVNDDQSFFQQGQQNIKNLNYLTPNPPEMKFSRQNKANVVQATNVPNQ